VTSDTRPAFYALAPGGWRDYVTLLHPPYSLWHLSFVVIGAALAPELLAAPLVAPLAAFFLAVGIGAHALDELHGRPLRTKIPEGVLWALAAIGIGGAVAIGIVGCFVVSWWLVPFVVFGGVVVVAYNLELLGGRLHDDWWFAVAWGGFPLLTGYFACAERLSLGAVLAAGFATLLSLAQRTLSTPVRTVRRRVTAVHGGIDYRDGTHEEIDRATLTGTAERALRTLAAATVLLAAALLAVRL
jgi:hypothetical protein